MGKFFSEDLETATSDPEWQEIPKGSPYTHHPHLYREYAESGQFLNEVVTKDGKPESQRIYDQPIDAFEIINDPSGSKYHIFIRPTQESN